jgi:hypothetical protein
VPPVAPTTGWRNSLILPRDYYVRLDGNDYSVHPQVIGQRVEVIADLSRVLVHAGGLVVADHARVWARHQVITDPAHRAAADLMRRQRITVVRPPEQAEVETRELVVYDDACGTGELEGGAA